MVPGHQVDLQVGTEVTSIDRATRRVELGNRPGLSYDQLLLATGSTARRLTVPGAQLDGVYELRTVDDAATLHEPLAPGGRRLVVIGSGWIGMEVAASARELGNDVTVLGREATPLAAIGATLGQVFADVHVAHGVDLRSSVVVDAIVGTDHVSGVRLSTGEEVGADLVLVGVGASPNTALAAAAGLTVDNGVLVSTQLQTDELVIRGDLDTHELVAFWVRDKHIVAALHLNVFAAIDSLEPLIRNGTEVYVARLTDPAVPLEELAG